jgi:hypothetical protein
MISKLTTVSVMLLCMLAACDVGSQRRFNRDEWIEEFENREPKRVKPAQILEQLQQQGTKLTSVLDSLSSGKVNLNACCNLPASNILDSLQNQYDVRIRCFNLQEEIQTDDSLEYALLDAYKYNLSSQLPLQPGSQKDGETHFLYTVPNQSDSCVSVRSYKFTTRVLVNGI